MKFTYYGPEAAVEVFGLLFPRGQAVEVPDGTDKEKAICAKLAANPTFQPPKSDDEPDAPAKGKKK